MPGSNSISKRNFLKLSLLGGCGLCFTGIAGRVFGNNFGELAGRSFGDDSFASFAGEYASPQDVPWKWSKEAIYFVSNPRGVKCKLCPQNCTIEIGQTGDCRTRMNYNGKLYSIAYGNPCAVHVDPIEKKPLYHFLPKSLSYSIATAGCNLACLNCQNWEISQASPRETRNYDLMPEKVVAEAKKAGCASISYTYAEPVAFYEYTLDTSMLARQQGIKNIIVSAGYINPAPLRQWCKYIDAANIDLKSFSNDIYEMLNAGTLQPVLDTLKILKEEGVWLEITNLVVPTWTDDMDMVKKMCDWLVNQGMDSAPLHFSRFQPLHKLNHLPATPVQTLEKARQIAINAGMKYVYIGNVPNHQAGNTYCPGCKKLLIERKGYFIIQNNLENTSCKFCHEKIDGVWV